MNSQPSDGLNVADPKEKTMPRIPGQAEAPTPSPTSTAPTEPSAGLEEMQATRSVHIKDLQPTTGHPCGQGRQPRVRARPRHGDHRPLGLWQVHDRPLRQPHARGDPRRPLGGAGAARRRRPPCAERGRRDVRGGGRDGLPEAQSVPDDVDLRQRRFRAASCTGTARDELKDRVELALERSRRSGTRSRTG